MEGELSVTVGIVTMTCTKAFLIRVLVKLKTTGGKVISNGRHCDHDLYESIFHKSFDETQNHWRESYQYGRHCDHDLYESISHKSFDETQNHWRESYQ